MSVWLRILWISVWFLLILALFWFIFYRGVFHLIIKNIIFKIMLLNISYLYLPQSPFTHIRSQIKCNHLILIIFCAFNVFKYFFKISRVNFSKITLKPTYKIYSKTKIKFCAKHVIHYNTYSLNIWCTYLAFLSLHLHQQHTFSYIVSFIY